MAYQDYLETVQRLYIAYYQRPADPVGLVYWAKALDWAGSDKNKFYAVIDSFANSAESQALYGGKSTSDVINAIYNAAFGRNAETGGLNYWTDAINKGYTTVGRVLWEIVKPGSPLGDDAITLSNKLQTAMNFTTVIDPEHDALNLLATYAGSTDAQAARNFLATVTNNPATVKDASACKQFIQQSIADAGDPIKGDISGQTITLTTEIDVKEGTNYNDVFIGDKNTVSPADTLNGLGGKDTLRLYGFTATVTIPNISKIEVIDVIGNATKVDVSAKSDVTSLIYRDMTLATKATLTVNTGQTITLQNINNAASKTITVNGATGVKSVDVVVDNVKELITNKANTQKVTNIKLSATSALTTLNLTASNNPSELTITGLGGGDHLNVKGTQNVTLTFTAAPNNVFIDATQNTGTVTLRLENISYTPLNDARLSGVDSIVMFDAGTGVVKTVNLSNQSEAFTITGGIGKDTITGGKGADTINGGGADDIINGGPGADTLTGGKGADTFIFANFATADKITDFVSGTDKLRIDIKSGAVTGTNAVGANRLNAAFTKVRILSNNTGKIASKTINKTVNGAAIIPTGAFVALKNLTGSKTTTAVTQKILKYANGSNTMTGGKDDRCIAFARTTVNNKLYLILLTDTNVNAASGAKIANIITLATVGATFVAGDIAVF
jgi:Ca2+-binding RTX toxin-like protein